jgi:hypothetical protein
MLQGMRARRRDRNHSRGRDHRPLGLPMWIDLIIEYVAGFAFGLVVFQSLFMKSMMGGSYRENLRRTFNRAR